ncbi:MAG: NAD(P)H-dependent oxidoreductase subunit E [Motiliproteus sp.]
MHRQSDDQTVDLLPPGPWPLPPQYLTSAADINAYTSAVEVFVTDLCQLQPHRTALLQILIQIQFKFGWIPIEAIAVISEELSLASGEIRAVLEFYSFLSSKFQGQYRVFLSSNITDFHQGQQSVLDTLCSELNIDLGNPDCNGLVSIALTSCTGLCDQGPAALINGHPIVRLDKPRAKQIAALIKTQQPFDQWPQDWSHISSQLEVTGPLLRETIAPGDALSKWLGKNIDNFLDELEKSGLRGRGGAGFNTYQKLWAACRNAPGDCHYVVCNADEGEPGTFKDRVLLQDHYDRVIEGMTLAAWVLGAESGFLYLRAEYAYLLPMLNNALQQRRQTGWLGNNIGGSDDFNFDIEIHLGAGAYVCGEETSLIESLEGKRGIPRIRPPFPVQSGYLQQPTLVNNVETFACVSAIAISGGESFAALGTEQSTGTKLHSISGDCNKPGIYEIPWGISIEEVLKLCDGTDAAAVQIGGPSGSLLGRDQFQRQLAFEDIPSGGSFMVFGKNRDPIEIVTNFIRFFAHESCGFCTPCRAGCQQLNSFCDKLDQHNLSPSALTTIKQLGELMITTSHCGLGKTAPLALLALLEQWPSLVKERMQRENAPLFDLQQALVQTATLRGDQ